MGQKCPCTVLVRGRRGVGGTRARPVVSCTDGVFSSWDNPDVSYETSTGTAAVFAVLAGVCGLSALVVGAGALVVWGRRIARASLPAGSGVRARYVAAWLLWSALLLAIVVIGVEYIDHQAGFSLIGFPAPYSW